MIRVRARMCACACGTPGGVWLMLLALMGVLCGWCPFVVLSGFCCSAFSRVRGGCCVSASCAATSAGKRNSLVAGVAEVRV